MLLRTFEHNRNGKKVGDIKIEMDSVWQARTSISNPWKRKSSLNARIRLEMFMFILF